MITAAIGVSVSASVWVISNGEPTDDIRSEHIQLIEDPPTLDEDNIELSQ
jgi:hypothetical protein